MIHPIPPHDDPCNHLFSDGPSNYLDPIVICQVILPRRGVCHLIFHPIIFYLSMARTLTFCTVIFLMQSSHNQSASGRSPPGYKHFPYNHLMFDHRSAARLGQPGTRRGASSRHLTARGYDTWYLAHSTTRYVPVPGGLLQKVNVVAPLLPPRHRNNNNDTGSINS